MHIDHIHPFSEGGETTLDNLTLACGKCNMRKGNIIVTNNCDNNATREEKRREEERRVNTPKADGVSSDDGKGSAKAKKKPPTLSPHLQALWDAAPAASRERSSQAKVAKAWHKNRPLDGSHPTDADVLAALEAWKLSSKWRSGYAEGLHIWIANRQWLNLPEPGEDTTSAKPKRVDHNAGTCNANPDLEAYAALATNL